MKKIVIVIGLLLGGCGEVEWFPPQEPVQQDSVKGSQVKVSDVGTYVASVKSGPGSYTVTTTRGAFLTYTSLGVPYKTSVSMETYTETQSGMLIGRTLKAAANTILVREILALVE